jgi:cbb3-type cytochrome oxidase maturation protein
MLAGLAVATLFLLGFVWSVRNGQYEDLQTPAMRVLLDEPSAPAAKNLCETGGQSARLPGSEPNHRAGFQK